MSKGFEDHYLRIINGKIDPQVIVQSADKKKVISRMYETAPGCSSVHLISVTELLKAADDVMQAVSEGKVKKL